VRPLVLLAAVLLPALAVAAPVEDVVPGRWIVHHRAGARSRLFPRGPLLRAVRALDERTTLVESDAGAATPAAALAADDDVDWVEPDRVRRANGVSPSDPLFAAQWSLPLARIPDAWARSRGSSDVVVAILDTGSGDHPDLRPRWLAGYDFVSSVAASGDGDGRDADATDPGTAEPGSSGLHGVHVAGIIGAHSDNDLGIAGVDWSCALLPVRVLGVDGASGADSDIADGIRWAAGLHVDGVPDNPHPAAVIEMSFGGFGGSRTLETAVAAALARGAIVIASAGNDSADVGGYAPAGLPGVIAVGAAGHTGALADYSNRGARLDLLAPGGDLDGGVGGILSTLAARPADGGSWGYARIAGSSQAAPHVAGVAALMRALDPTLDGARARAVLVATADPRFACDEGCGAGLLDADAALGATAASCTDGHCVAPASPAPSLHGGCGLGGYRGGGPGARALSGLLIVALALARPRARGRRRRSPARRPARPVG
jgi:serine protease